MARGRGDRPHDRDRGAFRTGRPARLHPKDGRRRGHSSGGLAGSPFSATFPVDDRRGGCPRLPGCGGFHRGAVRDHREDRCGGRPGWRRAAPDHPRPHLRHAPSCHDRGARGSGVVPTTGGSVRVPPLSRYGLWSPVARRGARATVGAHRGTPAPRIREAAVDSRRLRDLNPDGDRTAGYLFAMERQDADPAGLTAAQHIATVTMLELADRYRSREIIRREAPNARRAALRIPHPEAASKRLWLAGSIPRHRWCSSRWAATSTRSRSSRHGASSAFHTC